jgi:hypothetical protein
MTALTGTTCSEAHAPARLLGVAQVAIETALRLTDPEEIHAHLAEALGRIKPPVTPVRSAEPRPVIDVQASMSERMRQLEPNGYPEKAVHA